MKIYLVTEDQLQKLQYEVDSGYGYGNDDEAPTAAEIRKKELPPGSDHMQERFNQLKEERTKLLEVLSAARPYHYDNERLNKAIEACVDIKIEDEK